jgi:hypothetical protein
MISKIIIAGSRSFRNYPLMKEQMYYFTRNLDHIEIFSGGQVSTDPATNEKYGADYLGELYAHAYGFTLWRFPADWEKYGRKAGYLRNLTMAEQATHLITFWDGKSPGTKMMIDIARRKKLKIEIIFFSTEPGQRQIFPSGPLSLFDPATPAPSD